ncbi:MFS transporter [Sphingopyxis sp. 113P3]|uniref:MFS transporter n=1 Tax=Sphingopyxis sp. (strain 113P3) TaxID=292913 RepID=UPI0006AD1D73|nr:MFS transporter [Sphingopyxis sp. 113P3]ALC10492.1 MFS transporter, DHA1 family, tetracycline resistance protein [Sphingopyxis sp. 113P3]
MSEGIAARGSLRGDQDGPPAYAALTLVGILFINMVGFGIVIPLLPFYGLAFSAEPWQVALIFSAFSVGSLFGEPLWGRLSDLYGRRILLISTVSGNCLCYLALAFADTAWLAFAIRLLGGFASGNGSVVQAYIADVTPPEKRARRMSWLGAAFAIGLIVGPAIGGSFVDESRGVPGFRIPLLLASAASACSLVALLLFVKEPRTRIVVARPKLKIGSALAQVVKHPVIGRLMLLTLLVSFAFTGVEVMFGLWAHARFGWGAREIGQCFAIAGAISAFTQIFVTGRLSERYGEAHVLAGGMAMTVVGCFLQPFSNGLMMTTALISLTAAGQSIAFPNVVTLISRTCDPSRQGQVLGFNNATGAFGRTTGPFTASLGFGHISPNLPYFAAAGLVAPAILLALRAVRHERRHNISKAPPE